jgi:hypothetical protein
VHYSKLQPNGAKNTIINKIVFNLQTNYAGNTTNDDIKCAIWLLVTFVSEACRFNSVRDIMVTYLRTGTFVLTSVENYICRFTSFNFVFCPSV